MSNLCPAEGATVIGLRCVSLIFLSLLCAVVRCSSFNGTGPAAQRQTVRETEISAGDWGKARNHGLWEVCPLYCKEVSRGSLSPRKQWGPPLPACDFIKFWKLNFRGFSLCIHFCSTYATTIELIKTGNSQVDAKGNDYNLTCSDVTNEMVGLRCCQSFV